MREDLNWQLKFWNTDLKIVNKKMATTEEIKEQMKTIKDPEIGLDIVTLGLIRKVTTDEDGTEILMTLTSPFCPFADKLISDVEREVKKMDGTGDVRVEITFDPPWEPPEDIKDLLQL